MPRLVRPLLPDGTLRAQPQPVLGVGDLTVRPWEPTDAAGLVAAHQDPAIRHWHMRAFDSEVEAADWIRECGERWETEAGADWAVIAAGTGRLAGRVGLRGLRLGSGFAEVSYWVVPEARGAGIAALAVERVARWALDDLGLHRLEVLHSVANEPSCGVARRAGFALEGTLRQVLRHTDGWHDVHLHARLAGDAT